MEPIIRNYRSFVERGGNFYILITQDDRPKTCILSYEIVPADQDSHHHVDPSERHIHPWEHLVYVLEGEGSLICDGKSYPLREGDGAFVPPWTHHYFANRGERPLVKIQATHRSISDYKRGEVDVSRLGTGQPPVIRNYRTLDLARDDTLIGSNDGVPHFRMRWERPIDRAAGPVRATRGCDIVTYIMQGAGLLSCDGQRFPLREGDGIYIAPDTASEWISESDQPLLRITYEPLPA